MTAMTSSSQPHLMPRSIQWRSWLGVVQGQDTSLWVQQTQRRRDRYASLLGKFTAAPVSDDDDLQINNPLSQHQQSSWSQFFKSADLQSTIDLDLVRTHPSTSFFQSPQTQTQMRNVLFVWAQLHPNVSYRQGMNELLAPIILSRSMDADDAEQDCVDDVRILNDRKFVEHDSFAVFESLMTRMARLFVSDPAADSENQAPPIVARSEYIQNVVLKEADPELYAHFTKIGVQPQLYGLRWLRLLLAREFHLDNVCVLWDAMFSSGCQRKMEESAYPLPLVDYLCVAMLQFVRTELLSGDHSVCIRRLLSYPPVEDVSVLVSRATRLLHGDQVSGLGSFVFVPARVQPEPGVQIAPPEKISPGPSSRGKDETSASAPGNPNEPTPQGQDDRLTVDELLGNKLDALVACMQQEIRKGQSHCDHGVLLQCLAKIKLIKDVLVGNLSFDSVAEDIEQDSHPLVATL